MLYLGETHMGCSCGFKIPRDMDEEETREGRWVGPMQWQTNRAMDRLVARRFFTLGRLALDTKFIKSKF